jgi:hypothetical protein
VRYLSPILKIAPTFNRVDATGQLGKKSAKIGPFFLSLGSAYIVRILKSHAIGGGFILQNENTQRFDRHTSVPVPVPIQQHMKFV